MNPLMPAVAAAFLALSIPALASEPIVYGSFSGTVTQICAQAPHRSCGSKLLPFVLKSIKEGSPVEGKFQYNYNKATLGKSFPNTQSYGWKLAEEPGSASFSITIGDIPFRSNDTGNVGVYIQNDFSVQNQPPRDSFSVSYVTVDAPFFPGSFGVRDQMGIYFEDTEPPLDMTASSDLPTSMAEVDATKAGKFSGSIFSHPTENTGELWNITFQIDPASLRIWMDN